MGLAVRLPDYLDKTLQASFLFWAAKKLFPFLQAKLPDLSRQPAASLEPADTSLQPAPPSGSPVPSPGVQEPSAQESIQAPGNGAATDNIPKGKKEAFEEKLLAFIQNQGQATTAELAVALDTARRTINRYAGGLISRGLLEKSGRYKAPVYRLKKGGRTPRKVESVNPRR